MELSPNELEDLKVKGTEVSYYIVCKRKLWLFSHGIAFERFSDDVEIGKIISEAFFKREPFKEVEMESFKIDFIKVGAELVVNEVKKSRKLEEAHIWQTKFYIYELQRRKVNCRSGVIHYPLLLKKIDIELSESDKVEIERAISRIKEVKLLSSPPEVVKKPYCSRCSYFDFCAV